MSQNRNSVCNQAALAVISTRFWDELDISDDFLLIPERTERPSDIFSHNQI